MANPAKDINRRDFMKAASSAGVASFLAATSLSMAESNAPRKPAEPNQPEKVSEMPTRRLGKTGVNVSILNQGVMFDATTAQPVLQKSLEWGVTMWDTANNYVRGQSELGIGMFFEQNPGTRKKIFIVTKLGGAEGVAGYDRRLNTSLERLKTDSVDLLFMHGIRGGHELTDEVKAWAEKTKKSGKIKFFGFSTHTNMNDCLNTAAGKGWIDAVMPTCNFRTLQEDETKKAIEACHKADIGLIAMKAMALDGRRRNDDGAPAADPAEKVLEHFIQRGFSVEQAKLKYLWQYEAIASVCVRMPTIALLGTNVAAALDKTELAAADVAAMDRYARATCNGYCQACLRCENGSFEQSIPEVMRCLMYYNSYHDPQLARESFAQVPASFRRRLATADFAAAQARCPQRLPIASMMREAAQKLA
ncbi:MAG TPA: aldo/keto reductase [Sedimentisphaerales bacterium]|nr:aldo/keto reductase [Sedimentisphaerales bacterium]